MWTGLLSKAMAGDQEGNSALRLLKDPGGMFFGGGFERGGEGGVGSRAVVKVLVAVVLSSLELGWKGYRVGEGRGWGRRRRRNFSRVLQRHGLAVVTGCGSIQAIVLGQIVFYNTSTVSGIQ